MLFAGRNYSILNFLDISANQFEGTLPTEISLTQLQMFYFSGNNLVGSVPDLPPSMKQFVGSHNNLEGDINHLFEGDYPDLEMLDLSHNRLGGAPLPSGLWRTGLTYLSLASNGIPGIVPQKLGGVVLKTLDLSSNNLSGTFPYLGSDCALSTLNLRNNYLDGTFDINYYPRLSSVDISENAFKFDVSSLNSHTSLTTFRAKHNQLHGSVLLFGLSSLQVVDLSYNRLSRVDFEKIGGLFDDNLLSLYINDNRAKTTDSLASIMNRTTLHPTNSLITSTDFTGVVCSKLSFSTLANKEFVYDESLFGYQQCQCDQDYFGSPPTHCFSCRGLEASSSQCGGKKLIVDKNNFIFRSADAASPLVAESCLSNSLATFKDSNCIGIDITYSDQVVTVSNTEGLVSQENVAEPTEGQLAYQCRTGSSGRLCSKCDCDAWRTGHGPCFYSGTGNTCQKCSKVFTPSIYTLIILAILLATILVLSTVFYFVLASKRSMRIVRWADLPILKRLLYRLIHMTSLGQITILVMFVQILSELTNWDVYAIRGWLKLFNAEGEGLGLRCLLPFLANPTLMLVLRLVLPFAAVGIVWTCVGVAELVYRLIPLVKGPRRRSYIDIDSDSDSTTSSLVLLAGITSYQQTESVKYPARALATSVSITVFRFLYFGTAMTAHEYLFGELQPGTKIEYVQSVPWMLYSEASRLRGISIPFILLYLVGFPVIFVVMSWKLRHKISSPLVRMYCGPLFENYRSHTYWWELVNTTKKLLVALLLRSLSSRNAFHPISVSCILIVVGMIVALVKPWKATHENGFDSIGSILLILSLASNWLSSLDNSKPVLICMATFDGLYILSSVFVIIWKTFRDETIYQKEWKARFCSASQLHSRSDPTVGPIKAEYETDSTQTHGRSTVQRNTTISD